MPYLQLTGPEATAPGTSTTPTTGPFELTRPWDDVKEVFLLPAGCKKYNAKTAELAKAFKPHKNEENVLAKEWKEVASHII
eukprot:6523070-Pyramimonas_sp.AAC.1